MENLICPQTPQKNDRTFLSHDDNSETNVALSTPITTRTETSYDSSDESYFSEEDYFSEESDFIPESRSKTKPKSKIKSKSKPKYKSKSKSKSKSTSTSMNRKNLVYFNKMHMTIEKFNSLNVVDSRGVVVPCGYKMVLKWQYLVPCEDTNSKAIMIIKDDIYKIGQNEITIDGRPRRMTVPRALAKYKSPTSSLEHIFNNNLSKPVVKTPHFTVHNEKRGNKCVLVPRNENSHYWPQRQVMSNSSSSSSSNSSKRSSSSSSSQFSIPPVSPPLSSSPSSSSFNSSSSSSFNSLSSSSSSQFSIPSVSTPLSENFTASITNTPKPNITSRKSAISSSNLFDSPFSSPFDSLSSNQLSTPLVISTPNAPPSVSNTNSIDPNVLTIDSVRNAKSSNK
jgi:hypothetical protein